MAMDSKQFAFAVFIIFACAPARNRPFAGLAWRLPTLLRRLAFPAIDPPMLQITDLTYRIAGRTLLERASVMLPSGAKTGFIGRKETDGMPVQPEAFARVKLG